MQRDIFISLNKQEAGQAAIPLCLSGFFFLFAATHDPKMNATSNVLTSIYFVIFLSGL
jgi:hypothetical protein